MAVRATDVALCDLVHDSRPRHLLRQHDADVCYLDAANVVELKNYGVRFATVDAWMFGKIRSDLVPAILESLRVTFSDLSAHARFVSPVVALAVPRRTGTTYVLPSVAPTGALVERFELLRLFARAAAFQRHSLMLSKLMGPDGIEPTFCLGKNQVQSQLLLQPRVPAWEAGSRLIRFSERRTTL